MFVSSVAEHATVHSGIKCVFSRQILLLVTITLFANVSLFLGKSGDLNNKIINTKTRTQIIG